MKTQHRKAKHVPTPTHSLLAASLIFSILASDIPFIVQSFFLVVIWTPLKKIKLLLSISESLRRDHGQKKKNGTNAYLFYRKVQFNNNSNKITQTHNSDFPTMVDLIKQEDKP